MEKLIYFQYAKDHIKRKADSIQFSTLTSADEKKYVTFMMGMKIRITVI